MNQSEEKDSIEELGDDGTQNKPEEIVDSGTSATITSNLDFNRNERHDINAFFIGKHQELLIGLDYNDLIKSYIVDFTTENVFIDAKLKKLRERYNTNEGDIIFEKYHSNYDNDNLLSFFNDNNNMEITTEESIAKWLIIEL
ncbi:21948_t:CDS:2 [Entrophospora sp. SA101]|nr:21948_t:CDS:2 [Entrophospora sp. SA101]